MKPEKVRFVEINEHAAIPVPRQLSAEEEAAIIAMAKAEFDPVASEAECKELLRLHEQGLLIPGEELLKRLEDLEREGEARGEST